MKIYFGHSRMTYGTDMEMQAINVIEAHYPNCIIVNPNIPKHQEGCAKYLAGDFVPGDEMGYFHDLTHGCEIGCFLQYYQGKWSAGSASEANYMRKHGKKIFEVILNEERLEEIFDEVVSLSFRETRDRLHEAGLTQFM